MNFKGTFWSKRCRGEDGLTLNEMLIAMVISAIIVVPITGSIFASLHTSASTMNRTGQTIGANMLSTYFGPDVQNAVQVMTGTTESDVVCGASPLQVDLLLTTVPGQSSISYYEDHSTPATSKNLYRRTCNAGVASAPIILIHSLSPSSSPNFQCLPDCDDATWQTIVATVTQSDSTLNPAPFSTTVQASRRVSP